MQHKYRPAELEAAMQRDWAEREIYKALETDSKKKFYCVSMLPYPSGKLHMGHVRNYTINDVMVRQMRMKGLNTLMPMGWDAFGLPAENAAIAHGIAPAQWTYRNIAAMKKQLQALGLAIDWSREITTCKPEYYQWNQWLFLKMWDAGLVYRQTGLVNWDPVDQTVLSNEQVIDGRGWRSDARVEKREIPMYYLRITRYADALRADLERLGWPENVKRMQRNWLGKSQGVIVAFFYQLDGQPQSLRVFTTRADTIMGVTYCAIAPEHPLAARLARTQPALQRFSEACKQGGLAEADLATAEKKGIATGFFVQHPLTGQDIEVWIANYVLMRVGEGAVMGVPAHDARDFAFAQKYKLPVKPVIDVNGQPYSTARWADWYAERGVCVQSGKYNGLSSAQAIQAIGADLKARGAGEPCVRWRLRDWGISRQRYWGTPIPIIHCNACGIVPVPRSDLPVRLPEDLVPDGTGNPLAQSAAFIDCVCPQCGARARRETDTMDTFIDSSWYFSRYACPDAPEMVDARVNYWMPMDQYIGGVEHAILHLLYARFWTKVMRDLGLVAFDEPARNLFTQGMVLNQTYYREQSSGQREWFNPAEVTPVFDDKGRICGAALNADGQPVEAGCVEKMSKSKNNGVDPQTLIDQYGADTVRLFTIFAAPPDAQLEWSGAGVEGAHRFLRRLWSLAQKYAQTISSPANGHAGAQPQPEEAQALRREIHQLLKQAEFDYQRLQYNTVVSAAMKMLNTLERALGNGLGRGCKPAIHEGLGILLRVLYPVMPHLSTALWRTLGFEAEFDCALLDAPWPEVDPSALAAAEIDLILQINGKTRGTLKVAQDAVRSAIEQTALEHEIFARFSHGQSPRKIVVVPGRLVNIVV